MDRAALRKRRAGVKARHRAVRTARDAKEGELQRQWRQPQDWTMIRIGPSRDIDLRRSLEEEDRESAEMQREAPVWEGCAYSDYLGFMEQKLQRAFELRCLWQRLAGALVRRAALREAREEAAATWEMFALVPDEEPEYRRLAARHRRADRRGHRCKRLCVGDWV